MSARGLQSLLATTITDRGRQEALLRRSAEAYQGFDLSTGEVADLMNIEAGTIEAFALQAHRLFYGEDLALEYGPALESPAALAQQNCA